MAKISRSGAGNRGFFGKSIMGNNKAENSKSDRTDRNHEININHSPFLDALNEVEVNFNKKELRENLQKIEELAKKLIESPNMKKLEEYKKMVQAFLKEALKKIYKVENKEGLKKLGRDQKIFISLEKIDKDLEMLTLKFIEEQSESLSIIKEVEGIQGLLFDILA